MDDRDFLDHLYLLWSKTTGSDKAYWKPETEQAIADLIAVEENGTEHLIGMNLQEPDLDFITAIHGCFPDLVRRLHAALDEADRADHERDSRECRIAELEMEVAELKADLEGLITR